MLLEIFLSLLGIYLLLGLLFAIVFSCFGGAGAIDPSAKSGTWSFRLIIIPGAAIFWPLLLKRWVSRETPPEEKSRHRRIANSRP